MTIRFLSYADSRMTISLFTCLEAAVHKGRVDAIYSFKPEDIDPFFKNFNQNILENEKGAGFWLWKSYFVNRVFQESKDDDIVIYCDAGVEFLEDVRHIINSMDQDIFFFSNGHQHVHWCKANVLQAILGNQSVIAEMVDHQQVQASVIFFRVNENTRRFVKEWLLWCQMPGFIDDSPSTVPNHPEFADTRHDQAILCCLQIKYGYKLHWWADRRWYEGQKYKWPNDQYPSMFDHHRKRDHEWENKYEYSFQKMGT